MSSFLQEASSKAFADRHGNRLGGAVSCDGMRLLLVDNCNERSSGLVLDSACAFVSASNTNIDRDDGGGGSTDGNKNAECKVALLVASPSEKQRSKKRRRHVDFPLRIVQ